MVCVFLKYMEVSEEKMEEKKKKKEKTPFDLLYGKKVIIQSNQGIIYEGTFGGLYEDYVILTNGKVIGRLNIAHADLILLKKGLIVHIHTKPKKIEPKYKTDKDKT